MNIKIRQGIFETNSSSSHSFSIGPGKRFDNTLKPNSKGIINVYDGDWPDKSNDAEVKLSYLLTFAYTIFNKKDYVRVRNKIYDVVIKFTGAKKVKFTPTDEIDHQSLDLIDERDIENPEFIKEFVFDQDTWVYIIWDSYDPDDKFFEDKELNKPLYKLEFDLPGISKEDSTLEISYRRSDDLMSSVSSFLHEFSYDPGLGVFKKYGIFSDKIDPTFLTYVGNWTFGRNEDNKIIIKPKFIL